MGLFDALRHRLRAIVRPGAVDRELDEELAFHESLTAQRLAGSAPADSVSTAAHREIGNVTAHKEAIREMGARRWLGILAQDIRYAARSMRRSPALVGAAALSLGVGIAACTLVFGVATEIAFQGTQYPDPDRLVRVTQSMEQCPDCPDSFSLEVFGNWERAGISAFDGAAPFMSQALTFERSGADGLHGIIARSDLFSVLSIPPQLGRTLLAEDDSGTRPPVVVLSDRFWRRYFDRDRNLIGQPIQLGGRTYAVVGVMPEGFDYPSGTDVWLPLSAAPPRFGGFEAVGRLAPQFSVDQAQARMRLLARNLQLADSAGNQRRSIIVRGEAAVLGMENGYAYVLVALAVGLTFLIACSNFGSLFLARAVRREREMGIRTALGATRGRLALQLFTETTLVCAAAALLGAIMIRAGAPVAADFLGRAMQAPVDFALDARSVAIASAFAALTAVSVGLAPAWHVLRGTPFVHLRAGETATTQSPRHRRLQRGLIVFEMSLVVVVTAAAVLLVNSFREMSNRREDLGYDTAEVVTAEMNIRPTADPTFSGVASNLDGVVERTRSAVPTGTTALWTMSPSRATRTQDVSYTIEGGREITGAGGPLTEGFPMYSIDVTPEFFATLGIPVLAGRAFAASDAAGAEPVVVVNEMVAESFWPGADPIGRRFKLGASSSEAPWLRVVGVVGNSASPRSSGLNLSLMWGQRDGPFMFRPLAQALGTCVPYGCFPQRTFGIVMRPPANGQQAAVRTLATELAHSLPGQVVNGPGTMRELAFSRNTIGADQLVSLEAIAALLSGLVGIGIALALVGVASLTFENVTRRTREFGIRMALGAEHGHIVRDVVGGSLQLAVIGALTGLAMAAYLRWAVRHVLDGWSADIHQGLLFGMSSLDPRAYVAALAAMFATVVIAALLPAMRAARVDPLTALRHD